MAIDPSLSGFAVATWRWGDEEVTLEEHSSKPIGKAATAAQRRERYLALIAKAEVHARKNTVKMVVVEGYAYAASNSGVQAGELGMLLRDRLIPLVDELVEVPPNVLKKFATGKGNSSKAAMVSTLASKHGIQFDTDNQADAFALLQVAKILAGVREPLKKEAEALKTLKGTKK
jgi:crossover junction endodeoxyribonuclease RuvC